MNMVLASALGGLGHLVAGLALGADEEHAAAAGDDVAHGQQGLVHQRQGLLEVDDVHAVAGPENERGHARVPAAGGMSKVAASFEELTQRGARKRHELFSGWSTAGLSSAPTIAQIGSQSGTERGCTSV